MTDLITDPAPVDVADELSELSAKLEQVIPPKQADQNLLVGTSDVAISVLAPSIQLRNRYDSYGIEVNDSSISLRIEFPVHRYLEERQTTEQGGPVEVPPARSLMLGADAQTT